MPQQNVPTRNNRKEPSITATLGDAVVGNDGRNIGDHRHRRIPIGRREAPVLAGASHKDYASNADQKCSAPGCLTLTFRASAGECAPIWPSADCNSSVIRSMT